jgi:hypothetical protein
MMKNSTCNNHKKPSEFIEIVKQAIHLEADSVTIEYCDDGLEICCRYGTLSICDVLVDRYIEQHLLDYIINAANLQTKPKGKIVTKIDGIEYTINVKEYDNLGESAFELFVEPLTK